MKKARQVTIPSDRPLTTKEFEDIKTHAINSSTWYATEYLRNSKQVTKKLLDKGYVRHEVNYLDKENVEQSFNIIDHVLEHLKENYIIDDDAYARAVANRYLNAKRGSNYVKNKLIEKGVDYETAEALLEELMNDDDTVENLEALAESFMRRSTYTKEENPFKKKQKLTSHLMSRGFSFDDIRLWEDTREE